MIASSIYKFQYLWLDCLITYLNFRYWCSLFQKNTSYLQQDIREDSKTHKYLLRFKNNTKESLEVYVFKVQVWSLTYFYFCCDISSCLLPQYIVTAA